MFGLWVQCLFVLVQRSGLRVEGLGLGCRSWLQSLQSCKKGAISQSKSVYQC